VETQNSPGSQYLKNLLTLMKVLEARNPFNVKHCELVAQYVQEIGKEAGVLPGVVEKSHLAAQVHTLGVLLQIEEKKALFSLPLCSDHENLRSVSLIQREEDILRSAFSGDSRLNEIIPIILQRHEWFNGSGVKGIKGEKILEEARLLAAADAYVDLATPKSHRYPATGIEVMRRISELAGSEFDPVFVNALASIVSKGEKWNAQERAYRFTHAQCLHWLDLGDFYRQSQQSDWAVRCYTLALRTAEEMENPELIVNALSKLFMAYWNSGDIESAQALLDRVQKEAASVSPVLTQRSRILRGLLEWADGRKEKGVEILEPLAKEFSSGQDLIGLFTTLLFLSSLTLLQNQKDQKTHIEWLTKFLNLLNQHDLFDLMIQYRPYVLLLLLSGIIHQVNPPLCRILLTRMGEPCVPHLEEKLSELPPAKWMDILPIELPFSYSPAKISVGQEKKAAILSSHSESNKTLQIFFLGSFRVETEGKVITEENWPTQKAMKLFAFLAYRRQSPVSDEILLEHFWPDREEEKARNSLRNALHHVRSLFKDFVPEKESVKFLVRSRKTGTLSLNLPLFVDIEEFENLYSAACPLVSEKKYSEALPILKQSLSFNKGDFLENIKDEWTETPRTHFSLTFLKTTLLMSKCCLLTGDYEAAELAARQILIKDDLQEEAYHYLIESLLKQGKKTEALKQYQEAIHHLEKELGISVSSDFHPLYEKIIKS
jgi:two-component SAPR family response regulator